VYALKEILADRLHWFGRGVRPVGDKAEAIKPYRYHIALENNFLDHFWTEKIADAYLGMAFPFYSGCKNLHEYFQRDAFAYIDIDDPIAAANTIESAVANNIFEKRIARLREARKQVLFEYNIFNETRNVIHKLHESHSCNLSSVQFVHPIKNCHSRARRVARQMPKAWKNIVSKLGDIKERGIRRKKK
jgi:hypothetical protein